MTVGVSKFDPANPTVADDYSTIPQAMNAAINLLMGALSADNLGNVAGTQTITLYDGSLFPLNGGWVSVGDEIISYTNRVNNTLLGIVRGAQGTQIRAHLSRAPVVFNFTATHLNVLANAIMNAQQAVINGVEQYEAGTTDGSATITLLKTPGTNARVKLYINGVFYTDGTGGSGGDFTRSGTVLTFRTAPYPPTGNAYVALYHQ